MTYRLPEPLAGRHQLADFTCGSAEQTEWLQRYARQSAGTGTTRVFVVTVVGQAEVVAYYAWCMTQVTLEQAPDRMRNGAGRYPQPVALLARLGVDVNHEGRGLGSGLLQDVVARLSELSPQIGCRGLLVHAESQAARDFYRHLLSEFETSPTDELHLLLLMKDIRRALHP